jgi:hypothetical protein
VKDEGWFPGERVSFPLEVLPLEGKRNTEIRMG